MVLTELSRYETTKLSKETADILTTQEGSHFEITNDNNSYHCLGHQGYCSF
jgi:hypothetical protein